MNAILARIQTYTDSFFSMFDKIVKEKPQEKMYFIPITEHEDYYQKIRPLLKDLSKGKLSNNQVILQLKKFQSLTLIHKEQLQTDFKQLNLLKEDIGLLFGKIAQFVLNQEEKIKKNKMNILLQSKNDEVNLTKDQIIYFMSLMALNLVPRQQYNRIEQNLNVTNKRRKIFPFPYDFANIFSDEEYKTKCVIEYLKQHLIDKNWKENDEKFTIKRKYLAQKIQDIIQKHKNLPMIRFDLRSDKDSIEDFSGDVKVDFANKYIGGGALTSGCVQEEIMFANHPELFTSVLFCEVMNDHEAIFFSGFRKYSKNEGYGWSTQYNGQEKIDDKFYKKDEYIVAIDAFNFPSEKDMNQVKKESIDRQIKKAYVGFSHLPQGTNVITGNWGCGAFNGDVRVKFMVQWLACSMAKKKMIYCPFGHGKKIEDNQVILKQLEQKQIGEVYQALIKGGQKMKSMQDNIFAKIKEQF